MNSTEMFRSFADNQLLFEAVKKAVEDEFTLDTINTTMDDEKMGQIVRARISGLDKVEKAFAKIAQHKTIKPKPAQGNPAR